MLYERILHSLRGQTAFVAWPKLHLEGTDYPRQLLDYLEKPLPEISDWKKFEALIEAGIAGKPMRSPTISDEPKLVGYSSIPSRNPYSDKKEHREMGEYGHGFGFSESGTILSALGECIERTCLRLIPQSGFVEGSANELKNEHNVVDLKQFINHTSQAGEHYNFADSDTIKDAVLKWMKGVDIKEGREILIPAQLVYVPSTTDAFVDEPSIRYMISTGTAFGINDDSSDAIYRGLLEIVERDGNMLTYLAQTAPQRIIVDDSSVQDIVDYFKEYRLKVDLFSTMTDVGIPSIMAVIRDETGNNPYLSVGSSANLEPRQAAMSAIREAQQVRLLLRYDYLLNENPLIPSPEDINTLQGRCLYWSIHEREKDLNFILDSNQSQRLSEMPNLQQPDDKANTKFLVSRITEMDYHVFVVDISLPEVRQQGFRVVRTIVPELHPMSLDEHFQYNFSQRLEARGGYKSKQPHPFP